MFDEVPTGPEWHEPDESELTAEEKAEWEELAGGWSQEHMLVQGIAESRIAAARLAVEQYRAVDALRLEAEHVTGASWTAQDDLAWRELRAEVGAVLRVHERTADRLLDLSRRFVHDFPDTLASLNRAEFTDRHARILVEEAAGLPDALLAEYERRVLPSARVLTPPRLAAVAAMIRAQLSPEALIRRHREAMMQRRVFLDPAPDGMAWVGALLKARDAVGVKVAVNGIARSLQVEAETRTLAQIEADVFRDLLVDAGGKTLPVVTGAAPQDVPAAFRGVRAEVGIHVPVLTVMGASDAPALLEGYGPIDAETVRELAGTASGFWRILTDPEDGAVRGVGRKSYRVPEDLRRHLRIRDEVCRFVGCNRPAACCDIDHTLAWAEDGDTVEENLAHLCRGHHRLKHGSRWRMRQDNDRPGTISWTSPTGRTYTSAPKATLPPTGEWRHAGAPPLAQTKWAPGDPPPPF